MTTMKRVRFGRIHADVIDFDDAITRVIERAKNGGGGYVVTPNVDHVCLAETDETLVRAYENAFLSLLDGKPLMWLARALGHPFPAKISGSDFTEPLVEKAASAALPVFFLGAQEGVGQRAADILSQAHPTLIVAGVFSPPLGFERDAAALDDVFARIERSNARIVLVALGCPKQEHFMYAQRHRFGDAVALGIGGTFDFIAGEVRRAPRLMSELGLEWTWRLAQQPGRMAHRYLVRDRAIVAIALKAMTLGRRQSAYVVDT